jgi:hypothetical protein
MYAIFQFSLSSSYVLKPFQVRVVATEHALHFFDREQVKCKIYTDADEWTWKNRTDPVLHIEVRPNQCLLVFGIADRQRKFH